MAGARLRYRLNAMTSCQYLALGLMCICVLCACVHVCVVYNVVCRLNAMTSCQCLALGSMCICVLCACVYGVHVCVVYNVVCMCVLCVGGSADMYENWYLPLPSPSLSLPLPSPSLPSLPSHSLHSRGEDIFGRFM